MEVVPDNTTAPEIYSYIAIPLENWPDPNIQAVMPESFLTSADFLFKPPNDVTIATPLPLPEIQSNLEIAPTNPVLTSFTITLPSYIPETVRPTVIEQNTNFDPPAATDNPIEVGPRPEKKSSATVKCEICGEEFDRALACRRHMQKHRADRRYNCSHCSESFNMEHNFKLHVATHSRDSLVCPVCQRSFQRVASLKAHIIVHTIDDTYVCSECCEEFNLEVRYLPTVSFILYYLSTCFYFIV